MTTTQQPNATAATWTASRLVSTRAPLAGPPSLFIKIVIITYKWLFTGLRGVRPPPRTQMPQRQWRAWERLCLETQATLFYIVLLSLLTNGYLQACCLRVRPTSVMMTTNSLNRGFLFFYLFWRGSGGLYPRDWHTNVNWRLDCSREALFQTLVPNQYSFVNTFVCYHNGQPPPGRSSSQLFLVGYVVLWWPYRKLQELRNAT